MKNILSVILVLALAVPCMGQISWRENVKQGDKLLKGGKQYEAATYYHKAWKQKDSKLDLLEKAGNLFYQSSAFVDASIAYNLLLQKKYSSDVLLGFKYARSLKQDAQYESAIKAFQQFLQDYTGDDKELLSVLVTNEIYGCDLGIQLSKEQPLNDQNIFFLNKGINDDTKQWSPVPVGDNLLFYTSNMTGRSKLYQTTNKTGKWLPARLADFHQSLTDYSIESACFSPDGNRFYFSACTAESGPNKFCLLYYCEKKNDKWSVPTPLGSSINASFASTLQPYSIYQGGKELLFFASNRKGGQGGMDIWYATRDLSSASNEFEMITNPGIPINTAGDELSPYYNVNEQALYFSSNGLVNLGGFDIFKAEGNGLYWDFPTNLGMPYNSCNDDLFYVRPTSGSEGYLSSNRLTSIERTGPRDYNLFSFTAQSANYMLSGDVLDKGSLGPIEDVYVSLYEKTGESPFQKFIRGTYFNDGNFKLRLVPGKKYLVRITKNGYKTALYDVNVPIMPRAVTVEKSFILPAYSDPADIAIFDGLAKDRTDLDYLANNNDLPSYEKSRYTTDLASSKEEPTTESAPEVIETVMEELIEESEETQTMPTTKPAPIIDEEPVVEKAKQVVEAEPAPPPVDVPAPDISGEVEPAKMEPSKEVAVSKPAAEDEFTSKSGEHFQVQIIALKTANTSDQRYNEVRDLGTLVTERTPDNRYVRVLIGDFSSFNEAEQVISVLKDRGVFTNAFVVRYQGDIRKGMVVR